ncbi:MAG: permease [Planctomycetota bacterium]
MTDWLFSSLLGGTLRVAEALISAAPTLLVGLMVAAVLRFYFGTDGTRRLFGGSSLRALPQSWAIGMLLPVCSIGVLPILIEMRRARLKAGALSAFALSAPLFNPLSLLYGVTLSRPYVILMFAFGSLIVVTAVGLIWDSFDRSTNEQVPPTGNDFNTLIGVHRLFAVIVYCCRQFVGPVGLWTIAACVGVATLASVLPWGALGHAMGRDDWMAPARMAGVAIPAYATPMLAMSQLGMMFQHANSPGAAFILLVIGAGVNFGTIAWMCRYFGLKSVMVWFGSLMILVVAIAYAINRPLIPPGVNPSKHTHAFDIYSNPIHKLDGDSGSFAIEKLQEKFGPIAQVCSLLFAAIGLSGLTFRALGISSERMAEKARVPQPVSKADKPVSYDRIVGSQVVGGKLITGLVVISVVMCYAFYPSPEECMEEIKFIRADAMSGVLSGDADHAKFFIPRWDEWSRRMEVGAFLRRGKVTPYQRMQGFLLRKKLDGLEHELEHEHDDPKDMRELVNDILLSNTRWVRAYNDPYDPNAPTTGIEVANSTKEEVEHPRHHQHDAEGSHDHSHDGLDGSHSHGHGHSHRHADAPHGGKIISLGHDRQTTGIRNPHLEVMPVEDGELIIYPLKESLGILRPVKERPGEIEIKLHDSNDSVLNMSWNDEEVSFRLPIPDIKHDVARGTWMLTDEIRFEFDVQLESEDSN